MTATLLSDSAQINHLVENSSRAAWGLADFCRKILLNDDKHKNAFRCTRGEGYYTGTSARVACICQT